MNVQRLREAVDLLIAAENELNLQGLFNQLAQHLEQLTGNPQDPATQTQFATTLRQCQVAFERLVTKFSAAQMNLFHDIKAEEGFFVNIPASIENSLRQNPATPAVTLSTLRSALQGRQEYLSLLTDLQRRLAEIGIESTTLQPGQVELGVAIPRDLFENKLDAMVREIGALNRFIRLFSEISAGAPEVVEVKQVSTSVLEFLLSLSPKTIAMIGSVIHWALGTWKQAEEIRKLRTETRKVASLEDVEELLGTKVEALVQRAIDDKINDIIPDPKIGRDQELRAGLDWALRYALSHVELSGA